MTVIELIDKLNNIPDKSLKVLNGVGLEINSIKVVNPEDYLSYLNYKEPFVYIR